jgi:hypothetical protein
MDPKVSLLCWQEPLPRAKWIKPTSSHPISFRFFLILSSHPCLILPSGFLSGFTSELYCVSQLSHEYYKLWSSSLRNFLQTPVTSSVLDPKYPSASCSETPLVYVIPLMWEIKFYTHTEQQVSSFREAVYTILFHLISTHQGIVNLKDFEYILRVCNRTW